MKEDALAQFIVTYLETKGYECYKEVCLKGKGGNIRSDCYAVMKQKGQVVFSLALETKTSFSLKVIQQAYSWKKHAHAVYIGVPYSKRKTKLNEFAIQICRSYGIGIFEVDKNGLVHHTLVAEAPAKKVVYPPLYEQQKSSVAGTSTGVFYTSYKHTVSLMDEYMKTKTGWVEMNDLLANIKHHYKSATSAKASLTKYITSGVIKGYQIATVDRICKIKKT